MLLIFGTNQSEHFFFVLDITRFQSIKQDYSKSSFQFVFQCLAFLVWDSSFIFNCFINLPEILDSLP